MIIIPIISIYYNPHYYLTSMTVFSSLPTTVRPTVPIERWVATQQDVHNHSQWPEITPLIIRVRFTNKSLHNFRSHELCTSNLKLIKTDIRTAAHLASIAVILNFFAVVLSSWRLKLQQHLELGKTIAFDMIQLITKQSSTVLKLWNVYNGNAILNTKKITSEWNEETYWVNELMCQPTGLINWCINYLSCSFQFIIKNTPMTRLHQRIT
jgi:hypothetical protein